MPRAAPDTRPDPDALLAELAPESAQAGLKIFLGAAPGVGKTWEMLVQARRRLAEGVDVVAGVIETHGRAETEAQLQGIPILPRRTVPYRGQTLEEFDLEAALERRPALLLVDELAHTNAPGSRHAKRWEDVAELLDAGIPVWATLNVQHLESLNDDVARITGVRPSETLPDRALEMADEIELIDVPPADLRARLREGKIYRPDTAKRALEGFFKEGNLAALREIALRRAAAHVDTDVQDWMRRSGVASAWPTAERVLALIAADDAAEAVVRQAKRLADALRAPWIALHIERPTDGPEAATRLRAPVALASALGADLEQRVPAGGDLLATLLDVARSKNATHLVIGRVPARSWRSRLRAAFRRRLTDALINTAPDLTLHVIPAPTDIAAAARRRPARPRQNTMAVLTHLATLAAVAAVTGIGVAFRAHLPAEASDVVYLAVVIAAAVLWGVGPAITATAAGIVAWDFFFVPPIYTLTIDSKRDLVTGVVFLFVAVLTGSLAARVRAGTRAAAARIEGLRRIGAFSRQLGRPATEPDMLAEIAQQAAHLGGRAAVLTGEPDGELRLRATAPEPIALDEAAWAAARWTWTKGEASGRGSATLPSVSWSFMPLQTVRGRLGVLGFEPPAPLDDPRQQALDALVDQAATALERVQLANRVARSAAQEETQRLRTALLASLGHDLRTPLTAIAGAAETLRGAWDRLEAETRADLLAAIELDVGRMKRFLHNITELTRLEAGELRPALADVPLASVVEAALARLPELWHVAVRIDAALAVRADPVLLEQAVFNVLDNAARYSASGSIVRIAGTAAGREATLSIADEGVGIPPEDLEHVFDSFFRAQRGDRTAPGTGLGLAIARGLIESMGGSIVARSPNPEASRAGPPGTVMTITLPRAAA